MNAKLGLVACLVVWACSTWNIGCGVGPGYLIGGLVAESILDPSEQAEDGLDGTDGVDGDDGADSTVPGPAGEDGADSTVPGPAGPPGQNAPSSPVIIITSPPVVIVLPPVTVEPDGPDADGPPFGRGPDEHPQHPAHPDKPDKKP